MSAHQANPRWPGLKPLAVWGLILALGYVNLVFYVREAERQAIRTTFPGSR